MDMFEVAVVIGKLSISFFFRFLEVAKKGIQYSSWLSCNSFKKKLVDTPDLIYIHMEIQWRAQVLFHQDKSFSD